MYFLFMHVMIMIMVTMMIYNKSNFNIDIYFIYTCNDNVDNDEFYRYNNYYAYKSKNACYSRHSVFITGFISTIYKHYTV